MRKKILLGLGAVLVVAAGVAALSAYEAHIINVTAHIENALAVEPEEIDFGTVFPQEFVIRDFKISLSDSFMTEDRVDDVEYKIVQKPKCICDDVTGANCPLGEYAPVDYATHECPELYHQMLSLCPFLSKIPENDEIGDIPEPSYYDQSTNTCRPIEEIEPMARGKLAKSATDTSDTWIVDLKVPPVEGYVGQDWPASCADWVVGQNDKDYGCDLWIEVTNISLPGEPPQICEEKPDVMQVFDRSGSIDSGELLVLKTAGKAFVAALAPSADEAHMGQTSFADTGSLDQVLTYDVPSLNAAIDALSSGGYTNLMEGIQLADAELESARDRNDAESPDFMVIITDGNPNRPSGVDARAVAKAAADTAKGKGVVIYVVGVGTTIDTAAWLRDNIATSPAHYFDAGDWSQLETILEGLVCP